MKITVADALKEGNWSYLAWAPRIVDDTAFQSFVTALANRAAAYIEWRVGGTHYADTAEPKNDILTEAEMHICQEQLLLSAAQVADTTAFAASPPLLASGAALRAHAGRRRERAEELLAPYDQGRTRGSRRPAARSSASTPPMAGVLFGDEEGRIEP